MDALIEFLLPEFWSVVLVLILVLNRRYRVGGIMLIALRSVNGEFNWWGTMIITIFIIFKAWMWDPVPTQSKPNAAKRIDPDQVTR